VCVGDPADTPCTPEEGAVRRLNYSYPNTFSFCFKKCAKLQKGGRMRPTRAGRQASGPLRKPGKHVMTVALHHKEMGQGPPLLILHGLFGTLDNWQTMGRALSNDFTVFLLDLRNHGRSPHVDDHTYPALAEDVRRFMETHWMYDGANVIGHSMGGKTAMQLALTYPELVRRLVVVDIAPKPYQGSHHEILSALDSLPLSEIDSRQAAEEHLARTLPDAGIRQFLMKNLTREKDGRFVWKMNLPVLLRHYPDVLAPVDGEPFEHPALFLRGGRSAHVLPSDEATIMRLFPAAVIRTLPDAGHWVHADAPMDMLALVRDFLA
jgi:pimeloyl-ACP methyl ester carboxylesterase